MKIINKTQNAVLAQNGRIAQSPKERLKGLLGRTELNPSEALYISPCTAIHSFFMRFAFDAIFIDNQGQIVHLISRMKPYRISKIVFSAAGVIELEAGTIERTHCSRGDQIHFEQTPAAREIARSELSQ